MIKRARRRPRLILLLAGVLSLGLLATACADDVAGDDPFADPVNGAPADDPFGPANGSDDPLGPANGAPDPMAPTDGDPAGVQLSGTMTDAAALGVGGAVAVAEVAGEAEVDVMLTNVPEGSYMAHIAVGDCTDYGAIAFTLGEIQASADGEVDTFFVVPVPVADLAVGHSVIVEDAEAEVVACAELA